MLFSRASGTASAARLGLPSSAGLARRAARGDRGAFEAIFRRFHQELYRYCLAILHDPDDAQDALQATMAAALRALPGEERTIELRPWLYRVAHNESISLLRARVSHSDPEPGEHATSVAPEVELEARDRMRGLVADLQQLPDRQRSALVMRELSDLSYAEIGEALTCAEGAARQTVCEARTALRELEEGREMDCVGVREAISAHDRRRLRGRRIRAHLRSCDGCFAFEAAIGQRRSDLQSLCPPLPALAAASILGGLLGGSGSAAVAGGAAVAAGGSGAATVAGAGLAGSAAVKGASVIAAAVVAVGAADIAGVVDVPGPLDRDGSGTESSSPATPPQAGAEPGERPGEPASDPAAGPGESNGPSDAESGDGRSGAPEGAGKSTGGPGQSGTPGKSDEGPGNSGSAPGQSATGPGKSLSAPGHSNSSPGKSESASGQSGAGSGNSESAPAPSSSGVGSSATAPGQTGSKPDKSNSGSPTGASGSVPDDAEAPEAPSPPSLPVPKKPKGDIGLEVPE